MNTIYYACEYHYYLTSSYVCFDSRSKQNGSSNSRMMYSYNNKHILWGTIGLLGSLHGETHYMNAIYRILFNFKSILCQNHA